MSQNFLPVPARPITPDNRVPAHAGAKAEPIAPRWLSDIYRNFRPHYSYPNGIRQAALMRVGVWRNTGEFVGFYTQSMHGPHGTYTERYVWVHRNGQLIELNQAGVRDVPKRIFRG